MEAAGHNYFGSKLAKKNLYSTLLILIGLRHSLEIIELSLISKSGRLKLFYNILRIRKHEKYA